MPFLGIVFFLLTAGVPPKMGRFDERENIGIFSTFDDLTDLARGMT